MYLPKVNSNERSGTNQNTYAITVGQWAQGVCCSLEHSCTPEQMKAHFCSNTSKDQLDPEKFCDLLSVQYSNAQQKALYYCFL